MEPTRAQKIKNNKHAFAIVQYELLQTHGKITHIEKVGHKAFNVIIGYECVKFYKQARSAKKYLTRLLNNLNK